MLWRHIKVHLVQVHLIQVHVGLGPRPCRYITICQPLLDNAVINTPEDGLPESTWRNTVECLLLLVTTNLQYAYLPGSGSPDYLTSPPTHPATSLLRIRGTDVAILARASSQEPPWP